MQNLVFQAREDGLPYRKQVADFGLDREIHVCQGLQERRRVAERLAVAEQADVDERAVGQRPGQVEAGFQFYANTFNDPTPLYYDVGYGEEGGNGMGAGDLGESGDIYYQFPYATVAAALKANDNSPAHSEPMISGGRRPILSERVPTRGIISTATTLPTTGIQR